MEKKDRDEFFTEKDFSEIQNQVLERFVEELPRARKRLGISQTVLGEKVGLSRQTISLIERKSIPLTWNNYLALLMFFTVNSDSVYYFPKKNGYKDLQNLNGILKIKNNFKD